MVDTAFPAPGSGVPGAPPPLHRPLTDADGSVSAISEPAAASPVAQHSVDSGTTRLTITLGSIAVGLGLARLLDRRRAVAAR